MNRWIILASGPSMCAADAEAVRGHGYVCAVNSTFRLAPWADSLYAADAHWWRTNPDALEFAGRKYCLATDGWIPDAVWCLPFSLSQGLGRDRLHAGGGGANSGAQAIGLAYLHGAREIVLLGYDMQMRGRAHWHEDHAGRNPNTAALERFRDETDRVIRDAQALGVRVINASRETALREGERLPLSALW